MKKSELEQRAQTTVAELEKTRLEKASVEQELSTKLEHERAGTQLLSVSIT